MILTISVIPPSSLIFLFSSDEEVQVEYCLCLDLGYISNNGSMKYMVVSDGEADYKVNGTIYTIGICGYMIYVVREQPVFIGLRCFAPLYVLVDNRSIFVRNLAEIPCARNLLGYYFSGLLFKPEPWYSIASCLEAPYYNLWDGYFERNCDLGRLLVDAYYRATGEDSGVFEAYINVTAYALIYTGHQFTSTIYRWTITRLKIHYSNLTVDKAYVHIQPFYKDTIKLKTIPLPLIGYMFLAYNILLPLSIIMLLIGLVMGKTRALVKKHFRIVLAAIGVALIVASLTLSIGTYNVYVTYVGIKSLLINGEPWSGTLQNNTIILRDVEGTLKAKVGVSYTRYESIVIELLTYTDGRVKELYRKYSSYEIHSKDVSIIPISPEGCFGDIVLRATYIDHGTLKSIQAKILSVDCSKGVVKIKLNPQLIVGYIGPKFNEINLLLAAIGSGMLVTAILGLKIRKDQQHAAS